MSDEHVTSHPAALQRFTPGALTRAQPGISLSFSLPRRLWPFIARQGEGLTRRGIGLTFAGAALDVLKAGIVSKTTMSRRTWVASILIECLDACTWPLVSDGSREAQLIGASRQLCAALDAGFRHNGARLASSLSVPALAGLVVGHLLRRPQSATFLLVTCLGAMPGQLLRWLERVEVEAAFKEDDHYTEALIQGARANGWRIELADGQTPIGEYLEHAEREIHFAALEVHKMDLRYPPEELNLRRAKELARERVDLVGTGPDVAAIGPRERTQWTVLDAIHELNVRLFNPRLADSVEVTLRGTNQPDIVLNSHTLERLYLGVREAPFLGTVSMDLRSKDGALRAIFTDGVIERELELPMQSDPIPSWVFDARFVGVASSAVLIGVPTSVTGRSLTLKLASGVGLLGLSATVWKRGHTLRAVEPDVVLTIGSIISAASAGVDLIEAHRTNSQTPGRFAAYGLAHMLGAYWSELKGRQRALYLAATAAIMLGGATSRRDLRTAVADSLWLLPPSVAATAAQSVAIEVADLYTRRRREALKSRLEEELLRGRTEARMWLQEQVLESRKKLRKALEKGLISDSAARRASVELRYAEEELQRRGIR